MVANDSSDTYDSNKASAPTPATPSKIVQISRWILTVYLIFSLLLNLKLLMHPV